MLVHRHRDDTGESMSIGVYSLKLEFPDGRWSVDEKQLPERPRVGELVEHGAWWRVRDIVTVPVRMARKPDREFFVCRPL
jgi:hypothetical protein